MLLLVHVGHRGPAYLAAGTEVAPHSEHAEVERRDRPHSVNDPHLLRMPHFVDGNECGTQECNPK
jgi:hypothetical protein